MEGLYHIGYIKKAHGLNGTCKIQLHHDLNFEAIKTVFLEQSDDVIPYVVERLNQRYLTLRLIDTIDKAKKLKGCRVFVPKKFIYFEDNISELDTLLGYTVLDQTNKSLGIITDFVDNNSSGLLVVRESEKEILIPFVDDFIVNIDHSKRELTMNLPDGLSDI